MRTKTLQEDADALAKAHRDNDPDTIGIYWCSPAGDEEIKLLEVSRQEPTYGEVLPVAFEADVRSGIFHKSCVILVNEEDFNGIKNRTIPLPTGWLAVNEAIPLWGGKS